jgi:peptidyl-Lys metalloendopeptidase
MHTRRLPVVALLAALALVSACASENVSEPTAGPAPLTVALSTTDAPDGTPLGMTFAMTNQWTSRRHVLTYQTPFDGIDADIFEVERDGEPVPYVGKVVKLAEPQPEDFTTIEPGETRSVTFDPSTAYDMTRRGTYTIHYRAPGLRVIAAADAAASLVHGRPEVLSVVSPPVAVASKGESDPEYVLQGKPPTTPDPYARCDGTQKASLQLASVNAQSIATKAYSYLQTDLADSLALYWTWFEQNVDVANGGIFTYWSTVTDHYRKISGAFDPPKPQPTFDCSCKKRTYYAYVYPTKPYLIYICGAFWTYAPDTGTDSKAGTLVHEMSHFNVTASTQDYVYGQTGALSLALTDPAKATMNADNHEYFAEEQP